MGIVFEIQVRDACTPDHPQFTVAGRARHRYRRIYCYYTPASWIANAAAARGTTPSHYLLGVEKKAALKPKEKAVLKLKEKAVPKKAKAKAVPKKAKAKARKKS